MVLPNLSTGEILDGIRQWIEIESPSDDVAALARMADKVTADYEAIGAHVRRIAGTHGAGDHLLVEGGARTAAAFLADDLVDRLLLYRAPVIVGGGRTLPDIGLADLTHAHGRWRLTDARALGSDRVEVYERG